MQIRNQPSPLAGCLWLYFSLSAKLFSLFLENVESLKERERARERAQSKQASKTPQSHVQRCTEGPGGYAPSCWKGRGLYLGGPEGVPSLSLASLNLVPLLLGGQGTGLPCMLKVRDQGPPRASPLVCTPCGFYGKLPGSPASLDNQAFGYLSIEDLFYAHAQKEALLPG